jgi:hypothetical protein
MTAPRADTPKYYFQIGSESEAKRWEFLPFR